MLHQRKFRRMAARHPAKRAGQNERVGLPREPHRFLNRRHEPERRYFRCGRYFTVGHEWYVTVRENRDLGPFHGHDDAALALARHVVACCVSSPHGTATLDDCGDREATDLEQLVRELLACWEQRYLRSENSAYVWIRQRLDSLARQPTQLPAADLHVKALEDMLEELDSAGAGPARSQPAAPPG